MLDLDLPLSSVLELTPRTAAGICEAVLDVESLVESLESGQPFTRKALCEYLGIGESTLSGWIKDGRIPRMAKNAIVLLKAQQMLAAEVRRLRVNDLFVVRAGDHYQVCELNEDDDGESVGRVLADNIGRIEDARLLASGRRALRVLQTIDDCGVFKYAHDVSDNQAFLDDVSFAERELDSHVLHTTNHAEWKTQFGRNSGRGLLDDLLADDSTPPEPKP